MGRDDPRPEVELYQPQVRLLGTVNEAMLESLHDQLAALEGDERPATIELTTLGGDAELGRRAMLDIELARQQLAPRRLVFLGKTVVYSAGVTLMSGFPREDRFLTREAMLLIHCRQLEQELQLSGPMRTTVTLLEAKLRELETGIERERLAFEKLITGSKVSIDTLLEKALHNWYVSAEEAVELGLVAGVV